MRMVQSGKVLTTAMITFSVTARATWIDYCNALSYQQITILVTIDDINEVRVSTDNYIAMIMGIPYKSLYTYVVPFWAASSRDP